MPLPKEQDFTIEDIYALPEGMRAELIDGVVYDMAPPTLKHQMVLSALHLEIGSYIRRKGGKCRVLPAPFAVFLKNMGTGNEDNYVEPDISVICDRNKLRDDGCHGAPDWVIEIVSLSSRKLDYVRKQILYYQNGVREYWIVDPMREAVVTYRMDDDWIPTFYRFTDKVKVGIWDDLEVNLAELEI